jgi:hypothetical protein
MSVAVTAKFDPLAPSKISLVRAENAGRRP